jgi:glycine dehydrogenase
VLAGLKVVVVNCDENGNIDLEDLRTKAELHSASWVLLGKSIEYVLISLRVAG